MNKLIVVDQTGAIRPRAFTYENGLSLNAIIEDKFGELYDWKSEIYLNDERILPHQKRKLSKPLHDSEIEIVAEVKGIIGDALSFVGDVVGDVLGFFIDIPDLPEQDTQRGSPNNTYQSQTNVVRAFQQKAVVCGSPRIYPDLIQEAIEYFDNNVRVSEQYLYCSLGDFTGGTIQLGNTAATRFPATIERYQPVNGVTTIPAFRVGQSVDEVDGQVIRGRNEGQIGTTYQLVNSTTATTYVGSTFTAYVNQTTDTDQLKTDFDAGIGSIQLDYTAFIAEPGNPPIPKAVSGTGEIQSMTLNGTEYTIVINNFNGPFSINGTYILSQLSTIISTSIGPFATPIQCEKLLFNIAFRQGLNFDVSLQIIVYELDGKGGSRTGTSQTFNVTYSEESPNDEINRTFEATITNGIDWYEFEIFRTNNESQDSQQPDVPTLDSVYCIVETGNANRQFQNATMLRTIIRSTPNATGSGVSNRINIVNGMQNMPSYNITTKQITANAPSRKCADAILFLLKDFHGYTDSQITSLFDLDALYEIQNRLDAINPELAQFDFTFDDTRQGLLEQISIITNVMRTQYFSDGNMYSFWRDESQSSNDGVLSRTDVVAQDFRDYSINRRIFVEGDKDSIQIEYIDRSINKPTFIYRSFNSQGDIVNAAGRNPKRVTLTGCQSQTNAENRANLEIRKLMYQHTQGSDTFLNSAITRTRGDVVLWDEIHETSGFVSGQIRIINGNTATINNPIDITKSYNLYFVNAIDGVVGPQPVTIVNSTTITVSDLSEAYQPSSTSPLGSRVFLVETTVTPQRWRVIDKQISGGVVQLTMNNYDERIYADD